MNVDEEDDIGGTWEVGAQRRLFDHEGDLTPVVVEGVTRAATRGAGQAPTYVAEGWRVSASGAIEPIPVGLPIWGKVALGALVAAGIAAAAVQLARRGR